MLADTSRAGREAGAGRRPDTRTALCTEDGFGLGRERNVTFDVSYPFSPRAAGRCAAACS
eukprot:5200478-Prymnesium_polylepis.1